MNFIIPQISDQNISLFLSKAQAQLPTKGAAMKAVTDSGMIYFVAVTVSSRSCPLRRPLLFVKCLFDFRLKHISFPFVPNLSIRGHSAQYTANLKL
jgi:hypothetical protein